jgi:glutamate/tyrosine decarboxylase-like PLP-dependent enzyme
MEGDRGRHRGDALALDAETMRRLGYLTVDALVEQLTDAEAPPLRRASPAEMQARLGGSAPEEPEPVERILERLAEDVLPFRSRVDHPRFFAFIPGSGTWPGALGDFIASACNIYAGSWMESAGPSQVELEVLGWFKQWIGYPAEAGGVLVPGGSSGNMAALACARERLAGPMSERLVIYVSDQAHSSLARGARILGFRPEQVRVIPTDASFGIRVDMLEAAMDSDLRACRQPMLVSASAGATNTGSIDPLAELAELCSNREVWLHADAAYGGFTTLTERGRERLRGLELADSVTLDPHKWLYQPFECGALLVRDAAALRSAFEITPDYLKDSAVRDAEVNFADLGIQLTRTTRALKLWISLRYFGVDAFRRTIERTLDLADAAARRVEVSDAFEPMAPPSLGIVCFRRRFAAGDEEELEGLNERLVGALEASGLGLVSSTRVRGRYAIRLCVLSHASTAEDVDRVLDFLERTEVDAAAEPGVAAYERHPDLRQTWLRRAPRGERVGGVDPGLLEHIPLFQGLSPEEAALAAGLGTTRELEPGTTLIEAWDVSRDFFVVLEGSAEVLVDGNRVDELGPDDFVGEMAALDWGAGFAYPRLATVVATTKLRVLEFPDGSLNDLVASIPSVARTIRGAVRARLEGL